MSTQDEKIIELNKRRALLLLIGSGTGVALGVWVLSLDKATIQALQLGSPKFLHVIAILSIVFFGVNMILGMIKLLDKKPGLVFDSSGIRDNSGGAWSGLIPWSDVTGAQIVEIRKQRFLVVKLRNPQKFLECDGRLKRALYSANLKICGSPIAISSSTLKINFFELISIFNQYQQKYANGDSL